LNAASLLTGNNTHTVKYWTDLILATLNKGDSKYVVIEKEELIGMYIVLITKKSLAYKLTHIATSKLKLGFQGKLGNKGATLIRFFLEDTSFCFVNCHLDSGSTKLDQRKRI